MFAPVQPVLVLRMAPQPLLVLRMVPRFAIENSQEVPTNETAAAMRLASAMGSGLGMAAT